MVSQVRARKGICIGSAEVSTHLQGYENWAMRGYVRHPEWHQQTSKLVPSYLEPKWLRQSRPIEIILRQQSDVRLVLDVGEVSTTLRNGADPGAPQAGAGPPQAGPGPPRAGPTPWAASTAECCVEKN